MLSLNGCRQCQPWFSNRFIHRLITCAAFIKIVIFRRKAFQLKPKTAQTVSSSTRAARHCCPPNIKSIRMSPVPHVTAQRAERLLQQTSSSFQYSSVCFFQSRSHPPNNKPIRRATHTSAQLTLKISTSIHRLPDFGRHVPISSSPLFHCSIRWSSSTSARLRRRYLRFGNAYRQPARRLFNGWPLKYRVRQQNRLLIKNLPRLPPKSAKTQS